MDVVQALTPRDSAQNPNAPPVTKLSPLPLRSNRALLSFGLLLALVALACVVPGIGSPPAAVTPTPVGDTFTFLIPTYVYNLEPGETVPGTRLRYVGRSDSAYQVTIDGLPATKRIGDSFNWQGVLAPGVFARYNLRLTTAVFGALPVAGPVEIVVFNPEPVELTTPVEVNTPLHFNTIALNYLVPPGWQIPGTTLLFEGITVQGDDQMARLTGLAGYPFLALGDSLGWRGKLRDNVNVLYNLRVTAISESGLRLDGTAELWITSE
jgi:hypothetical protein